MGQKDVISKQIFKRILVDVATYIFKLQLESVELIETEQQRVEDRRADLVAKVVDSAISIYTTHGRKFRAVSRKVASSSEE